MIINEASQAIVDACMPVCTFSKDAWRYSTDAVFLDETGLSQICMRRCIERLKQAGEASINAAFGASKQVLEITTEETHSSIVYGFLAVTVTVIAIGAAYFYTRGLGKTTA